MPRKVLISFLGTGPFASKETRTYRTANYRIGETDLGDYPFVAAAIRKYYKIETVLLIGTPHSMWEEVYRWFSKKEDKIYEDIWMHCEMANNKSSLEIPHIKEIEHALGGDSKVVLIKYGITDEEIQENINIILGLQEHFQDGDELIVDITHSFRSLPIFLMNLLVYLQDVSPKRIKISHIHYGMLEMLKEPDYEYAPIVDLKGMMTVQEWITGVYNFMEFGNAYKLAELLRKDDTGDYEESAQALEMFSDIKNLNYLRDFKVKAMNKIRKLTLPQNIPHIGQQIIPDVVQRFMAKFPQEKLEPFIFQFRMAEWHREHHNYGYALINLAEAITTFCCKIVPADLLTEDTDNKNRELIRKALYWSWNDREDTKVKNLHNELKSQITSRKIPSVSFTDFAKQFCIIQRDRNMIGHDLDKKVTYRNLLNDLEEGYKFFKGLIGSKKYI